MAMIYTERPLRRDWALIVLVVVLVATLVLVTL